MHPTLPLWKEGYLKLALALAAWLRTRLSLKCFCGRPYRWDQPRNVQPRTNLRLGLRQDFVRIGIPIGLVSRAFFTQPGKVAVRNLLLLLIWQIDRRATEGPSPQNSCESDRILAPLMSKGPKNLLSRIDIQGHEQIGKFRTQTNACENLYGSALIAFAKAG